MSWKCEKIHESPLRPARGEEEYLLHDAALEWSLADSIVIQSPEDIQSRVNWRDHLEPYHHQVQNLFTFCRRLPVTLLADDVGLGKTISAGLILSELMTRKRVSRALVLCPKILCEQWKEELDAKFGIKGHVAIGERLNEEIRVGAPVVVTTYESATDRLANIKSGAFDMLILDEAHKLRNLYGSGKPPKMATSVRSALAARQFKYVVMLTATPMQNRLWDLYSLIDCLTVAKNHPNPFGPPDEFKKVFLKPGSDGRQLHPLHAEPFRRILQQYVVRTRREDARLLFPTREVRLVRVDLSVQEQQLNRLVAEIIGNLDALLQISLAQAMMSSPAALAAQLENMAERQPWLREISIQARKLANACTEPAKLQRLVFLCDELQTGRPDDWRVVVFTSRKETQRIIGESFSRRGIATGYIEGGKVAENQLAIKRLRENPPRVHVLISTDAGAEGINLQAANVLVNYDLPWNPMVVEQRIGRLQRLASKHQNVVIINLVAAGSVEERVVGRLMEKLQTIAHTIGDIESILESSNGDGEEDRFESQVRELVVKSLLGQNVETATRLAQESIERARQQIESQRAEIDTTLGKELDELHKQGPWMPRLERVAPALAAQDFVLRAKRADKGTVLETSPGVYEVRIPGRPHEVIAFDERLVESLASGAVFMGRVKLYQPGKAEFERLVQHWVEQCGHHICDLRRTTEICMERLAKSWSDAIPAGQFLSCQILEREAKFQGRARVKVKASNGVDSYEKLISGKFHPEGHQAVQSTESLTDLIQKEILPGEVLPELSVPLSRAVESNRDVAEFCRFYEERLSEELRRAGDDPRLRHKVNEDFTPSVVADIVGVQGIRYDEVRLQVRFSVEGKSSYEAALRAVPVSGQLLEEPERKNCEHTGLRVPVVCLEMCQVTGKLVLKHLLEVSEESGRRALRDRLVTCQVTGKRVFDDEVEHSVVSGTVGVKSVFVICQQTGCQLLPSETGKSAVSGKVVRKDLLFGSEKPPHRLGLAKEFGTCQATNRRLLIDELVRSAVSGKLVDRELLHASARSGQLALPDELVTCQDTNARLLPEETGTCVVSGRRVDIRLLARSEVSGAWALAGLLMRCAASGKLVLPAELEECAITGVRALPSELAVCAVTGKRALRSRMVICQRTGGWILWSEASRSDQSGKTVRRDLLTQSEKSPGRWGLSDEFGECEFTAKRLLFDELARSSVSGKLVDKSLLRRSDRSGALALKEEMVYCQESGAELLPTEAGRCAVTNKIVDSRLLSRSEVSKTVALKTLCEKCAVTGKVCLSTELSVCEITGVRALPSELGVCAVSGKRVPRSRLVGCQKTGEIVLDTLVGRSAVSGILVKKDLLIPSAKNPHRLGLADEITVCQATGRRLLRDETDVSAVSCKRVDRDLLVPSARSGARALVNELITCEESQTQILPSEAGRCSVTRKLVDSRFLSTSGLSGRVALNRLMRRCASTGELVLAQELEQCGLTGKWVVPSELETCAVTGVRGMRDGMLQSEVSGKYVVQEKAVKSAISGRIGLPDEVVRCAWQEQLILRQEAKGCTLTRMLVARSLLNEEGELIILRRLLDGRAKDSSLSDELISRIRELDPSFFKGLTDVRVLRSPQGGKLAVCGEIQTRGWFGMKVQYVGFLLKVRGDFKITGKGVLGSRGMDGWVLEDELTFT